METILPQKISITEIPKWVTQRYSGMEQDIESWLFSYFFWKDWDGKEDTLTSTTLKARAIALAKYKALSQTHAIKYSAESSEMLQFYEANKTGWFKLVSEIDDVKELMDQILIDAQSKDPSSSSASDLNFIVNSLLPALENANVPKELILCIPQNMTKARWAVPTLRKIIANDGEKKEEHLLEVLRGISDKTITVDQFKQNLVPDVMRSETPKTLPPAQSEICMLPDGDVLVITKTTPAHVKAIEASTRGVTSGYNYTDPAKLIQEYSSMIAPKTGDKKPFKNDGKGNLIEARNQEGTLLPSPKDILSITVGEYLKHRYYVNRPGMQKLLIADLSFGYSQQVFLTRLNFSSIDDLFKAVANLYQTTIFKDFPKQFPSDQITVVSIGLEIYEARYYLCADLSFPKV